MFKLKETKLRNFSLKYANLFSFICECSFSNFKFQFLRDIGEEFKGRIRGDIYINREVDFIKFDGIDVRKSTIVIELANKNL